MDDLIEALLIFRKYTDTRWPTNCEHDVLTIMGVYPHDVAPADIVRLSALGFDVDEYDSCFQSFRFGSA